MACTPEADAKTGVVIFKDDRSSSPHLRTVMVGRSESGKWTVTSETTGPIDGREVPEPTSEHFVETTNTREAVPTLPESVVVTGLNRQRLTNAFNALNYDAVATLLSEIGVYVKEDDQS
jgi:hypothetical protein